MAENSISLSGNTIQFYESPSNRLVIQYNNELDAVEFGFANSANVLSSTTLRIGDTLKMGPGNYTFPLADGTSDQVLKTNGSGTLSWATQTTGPIGNLLRVDDVYGDDTLAAADPYTNSFKTIESAIANVSTNQTIYVYPGTYNLSAGITIPTTTSIRGVSLQTVTIQMLNVSSNTTLVTMGENTHLEDVTLKLTSTEHHTLKGIVFPGTTTVTAKLRTSVVSVNNSTASTGGTSEVYGIECSGTGDLGPGSFSFNCLKGSTVNVSSNGGGKKRGVLVSNTNIATSRDFNVYVASPSNTSSTGSYVGIETNDPANTGSIQMRSTTIGVKKPTAGQAYTASDILQTTPATISDPTYLASPGIQIGPGTDLVTKSAGSKGFTTYVYPTNVYFGLKGTLVNGGSSNAYMWPGTQAVTNNTFPDPDTTLPAFYSIQQPSILSGMRVACATGPGNTGGTHHSTIFTVYKTPSGGSIASTIYSVGLASTTTVVTKYDASVDFGAGDKIHLNVRYTGGNANTTHDITAQLDLF
jgi:hypothetical protein